MKLKGVLKKAITPALVCASAALVAVVFSATRPKGIPVRYDADGAITEQEEKDVLDLFENGSGKTYNATIRNLVNDFDVFVEREFSEEGLGSNRIRDDLHVVVNNEKTIEKCGEMPVGCYQWLNSTIYLRESYFPVDLIGNLEHEIGHDIRGWLITLRELPSQANEFYAFFKMYSLNRNIGAEYAVNVMPPGYWEAFQKECNISSREWPYMLGATGFLAEANLSNGNLETAMDRIFNKSRWALEDEIYSTINKYSNICEAYREEARKLVNQQGFRSDMEKHMPSFEAEQFIRYLNLRLDYKKLYNDNDISSDEIYKFIADSLWLVLNKNANPVFSKEAMELFEILTDKYVDQPK